MRRLREGVDHRRPDVAVAGSGEQPGVAPERRRVAADEHEHRRAEPGEGVGPRLAEPAARRVGDDDVDGRAGRRPPAADLAPHDLGGPLAQVVAGVGDRRARRLDGDHPARRVGGAHREHADTGVGVDHRRRAGQLRCGVADGGDEQLGGLGTGLEERAHRDLQAPPGDVLGERRRRADGRARRGARARRLGAVPAGRRPLLGDRPAHRHLDAGIEAQPGDDLGQRRVGDEAGRRGDDVVAVLGPEAGRAVVGGGHPHRRAVAEGSDPAAVDDDRVDDAAGAPEGVGHDRHPRRPLRRARSGAASRTPRNRRDATRTAGSPGPVRPRAR